MRTTLGDLSDRGHANNFNLIRLVAAAAVILSHSFPLSGVDDPISRMTGYTSIGDFAIAAFFMTSGFLVTKSLLTRGDMVEFLASRMLRIYPGLIVMVLLTVLVAGAVSPRGFFTHPTTLQYATSTAFLWLPKLSHFDLPGIFTTNPVPNAVNGSLHTLPFELRMYVLLAVIWAAAALWKRRRQQLTTAAFVALAFGAGLAHIVNPGGHQVFYIFEFFVGAVFFVLRRRIVMDGRIAWALAIVTAASLLSNALFPITSSLFLGYVLFAVSYLPKLWRPTSDYSYGTYIYAFPVQQTIAALIPGVSWLTLFLLAVPVVLVLAAVSWHVVEKPAIALKSALIRRRTAVA